MRKTDLWLLLASLLLAGCSTSQAKHHASGADRQAQLACEQEALVAQEQYLAQIKTPMYTSSRSTTWAGGARSDNGKWVFDGTYRTCLLRAQQAASVQP